MPPSLRDGQNGLSRQRLDAAIEALGEKDTVYVCAVMEKIYAGEIDRRDKILASMSILAAPSSILVGGVAVLTNNAILHAQDYVDHSHDLAVVLMLMAMGGAFVCIGRMVWCFNLLLSGENYAYMPYADAMLAKILELKNYLSENVTRDDAHLAWFSESMRISMFANAATQNAIANEMRIRHRQGVFRNFFRTVAFSVLAFALAALHQAVPQTLSP